MGNTRTFTATELKTRLARDPRPLLIDVLPAQYFAAAHIEGARNACVYETSFLDQVAQLTDDKSRPIIVYGASDRSLDSTDAMRKLIAAGYTDVSEFPGGMENWQDSGFPIEGTREPIDTPRIPHRGAYTVDTEKSVIFWTGRNLFNSHDGTLGLQGGEATVAEGKLEKARIVVDMNAMTCTDLKDETLAGYLIAHLKNDDFFETDRFPVAEFLLTDSRRIDSSHAGKPNFSLSGALTLKEQTHPITFDALLAAAEDGSLALQAHFDIDRTLWNVRYGSGKLYEKLGMHLVNDEVSLQLRIFLKPA